MGVSPLFARRMKSNHISGLSLLTLSFHIFYFFTESCPKFVLLHLDKHPNNTTVTCPRSLVFSLVLPHQTQTVGVAPLSATTPCFSMSDSSVWSNSLSDAWCLQIAHSQQETSANFVTVELHQVPFAWDGCAFKIVPAKALLFPFSSIWSDQNWSSGLIQQRKQLHASKLEGLGAV